MRRSNNDRRTGGTFTPGFRGSTAHSGAAGAGGDGAGGTMDLGLSLRPSRRAPTSTPARRASVRAEVAGDLSVGSAHRGRVATFCVPTQQSSAILPVSTNAAASRLAMSWLSSVKFRRNTPFM